MSDNVTANAGAGGATFATDQDSGTLAHYPKTKIVFGPNDTFTDVESSVGLPVNTELPAAASLADAASNPTTPTVGVALLVFNGATWDRLRAQSKRKDLSAVSITSIATVWTPASGKKIRLMGGMISVSAAASVLFEDNAGGTTVIRTPKLGADTPYNFDLGQGVLLSAADNVLKATSSAAASITGTLYGCEE